MSDVDHLNLAKVVERKERPVVALMRILTRSNTVIVVTARIANQNPRQNLQVPVKIVMNVIKKRSQQNQ